MVSPSVLNVRPFQIDRGAPFNLVDELQLLVILESHTIACAFSPPLTDQV